MAASSTDVRIAIPLAESTEARDARILGTLRGHVSGLEQAQHMVMLESGRLYAMGGADTAAATCRVLDGMLKLLIHQAIQLVAIHIEDNPKS